MEIYYEKDELYIIVEKGFIFNSKELNKKILKIASSYQIFNITIKYFDNDRLIKKINKNLNNYNLKFIKC